MKFKEPSNEVEVCEDCFEEIAPLYVEGHPDYPLCLVCQSKRIVDHQKSKCVLCNKKMGEEDFCYNTEDQDSSAHTRCVNKLSEDEKMQWSDDFDY